MRNGEPVVSVACPDGMGREVPAWMMEPQAAQLDLRDPPRISLTSLRELQRLLAVLQSMWDASQPGQDSGATEGPVGGVA